jgi:hypothetical protein
MKVFTYITGTDSSSRVCEKSPKKEKRKKSENSKSPTPKNSDTGKHSKKRSKKSEKDNSDKKFKLDLENLVSDFLEREGFDEVRHDLLKTLRKQKGRKERRKKSSKNDSNNCAAPLSVCDSYVYGYLLSNPEFSEVAGDFEQIRGPFPRDVSRTPSRKRKKKGETKISSGSCPVRQPEAIATFEDPTNGFRTPGFNVIKLFWSVIYGFLY